MSITQITEDTFEQVLDFFNDSPIIELREASFIDPYGMVGILEIGERLKSTCIQKTIHLPMSEEVLKYLMEWQNLHTIKDSKAFDNT